jgi:hypothetical protein
LQTGHGVSWRLRGQPLLYRLVEAFHLATGLGMVGAGMADLDPEQAEFNLQSDPALAALFRGEDRPCRGTTSRVGLGTT